MTSRETLAVIAIAAPLAVAILVAIAPRRLVAPLARGGAVLAGAAGAVLGAVALADPGGAEAGRLLVVDALAGLLVLTIALVGVASVLVSGAYLDGATASLVSTRRRERVYYVVLFLFWGVLAAVPLAANLGAAWLLVEATTATSAILVGFAAAARTRGGVEVPDPDVARARRRPARDRSRRRLPLGRRTRRAHVECDRARERRSGYDACRLPAAAGRTGGQDRLGAGAQLAARCPFGGAAAGLGAALRGAAAGRAARRLAVDGRLRAADRRGHRPQHSDRVRPRVAARRRAVPVAAAGVEAPARLLEPRAHGGDRARHRIREPARAGRRRDPRARATLSRSRSGSTRQRRSWRRIRVRQATRSRGVARSRAAARDVMGVALAALPASRRRRCSRARS